MPRKTRSLPKRRSKAAPEKAAVVGDRLQKVLAAAGLGSRRKCEDLILSGRVEIDRQVVTELGIRADPQRQEIRVDGQQLPRRQHVYYLLHKPRGYLCTNRDPSGRPRVLDLVPDGDRLFTVGRLDMASEGLILITNDGGIAHQLAHPHFGVLKTYLVEVAGNPPAEELSRLRRGIHLAEGVGRVERLRVKNRRRHSTILELVLGEGRNREIRRMLARIGHKVLRLRRTALGPLRLEKQPVGSYRSLTHAEVTRLRRATQQANN